MATQQTQNPLGFNIENIANIIGPDGIQTSNEVMLTPQTWALLFAFILTIFLLFIVMPRFLK